MADDSPILITGGAGFIGANFILEWLRVEPSAVINLDKLTYAGNLENLAAVAGNSRYHFVQGEIGDRALVAQLLTRHHPWAIVNFAAETHVDRSIQGPDPFVQANVLGTFDLLEAVRDYWSSSPQESAEGFRFLHISTDEVYGSLEPNDPPFTEQHPYQPRSPYSASKAAADHLVGAYHHTYGLPTLITNCSNNYGPYQFPEKLIPLVILNALRGEPLPVYGDGGNRRDWLYVLDHCDAVRRVLHLGRVGESYNVGGGTERANLEVVHELCVILDELRPRIGGGSYRDLISFVGDRPGHDRRYAIDASKTTEELGWRPRESFATGLRKTVAWYLDNEPWVARVLSGRYREWIDKNYRDR